MALISQKDTKKILKKYNIPYVSQKIAASPEKAVNISKKIGFPVVFKIDSPDIIHKSDFGAVITNIKDETDAEISYHKIIENSLDKNPNAKINGVLIQKQLYGRELIIGMKRDKQFGPVLLFGLGGIFVEIFNDVSRRIAPIFKNDAIEMIKEIKSKKILDDFRGQKAVKKHELVSILLKLSELSLKEKKISEIDFNPVISNSKESVVVDARMIKSE